MPDSRWGAGGTDAEKFQRAVTRADPGNRGWRSVVRLPCAARATVAGGGAGVGLEVLVQAHQRIGKQVAQGVGALVDGLKELLLGRTGPRGGQYDGILQSTIKSAARSAGSQVGRELMRGVLGSLLGGRK